MASQLHFKLFTPQEYSINWAILNSVPNNLRPRTIIPHKYSNPASPDYGRQACDILQNGDMPLKISIQIILHDKLSSSDKIVTIPLYAISLKGREKVLYQLLPKTEYMVIVICFSYKEPFTRFFQHQLYNITLQCTIFKHDKIVLYRLSPAYEFH